MSIGRDGYSEPRVPVFLNTFYGIYSGQEGIIIYGFRGKIKSLMQPMGRHMDDEPGCNRRR